MSAYANHVGESSVKENLKSFIIRKVFNYGDFQLRVIYFFVGLIFLFSSTFGISFAAYNDAGTEYSSATSDSWVQDRAGDGLNMVNAFVCIVKNSNGGTYGPNLSYAGTCPLYTPLIFG